MRKIHYAWFIVIACCAITSCGGIVGTASSNFYQSISEELNIGIGKLTLYITIMSLTMAFLFPTAGKFLDKYLKPTLLFGGVCQYIALGAMSCFNHVYQFYIAGFFLGIGMSITLYMAVPILINMWFCQKTGLAMGIAMSFNGVSAAIFSQVAGLSLSLVGWRASYIVLAVCGLCVFVPAIVFIVKTPQQKGLLPYGYDAAHEQLVQTNTPSASSGIAFSEALKRPEIYCMLILSIALSAVQSETPHVSAFSFGHFGFSIQFSAMLLSIFSIGMVIGNISFGAVDDKIGHLRSYILGIGLIIGAHLALLCGHTHTLLVGLGVFAGGFSLATFTILLPLMTSSIFGLKDYNKIWAYMMSAASLSGAVVPPLYGLIYDVTQSYTLMFIVIIFLALISLVNGLLALRPPGLR